MKLKALLVAALLWLMPFGALAQNQWPSVAPGGPFAPGYVNMCLNASSIAQPCGNVSNPLVISGSFSATISGFAYAAYANLTSTIATSASTALPAGTDVIISNTGTSAVSCTPSSGAATGVINNIIVAAGTSLQYTKVGGAVNIACINQNGDAVSNKVVLQGGAGLATGWGGGGGGGSGSSAITSWGGGTLGAMANYGTTPGAVLVPGMNAFITNVPAVSQSGIFTVQPGNTPNTAPWLTSPPNSASTMSTQTIATAGTFQQALASNAARKGCTIQYIGVAGTKGYVFPGANPGVGVTNTSYQLNNGDSFNCQSASVIIPEAIQVSSNGATDIFIVSTQ